MLNSMLITHTNLHSCSTLSDQYQTRTGDENSFLSVRAPLSATTVSASPAIHCAGCDTGGLMISAERAATICQCSRRLIYRWIDEGSLHFRELPDGAVLVCGVTLAAKLEQLENATGVLVP